MIKKILLTVIIAIVVIASVLCYINKDSIELIYNAYFVSKEDLEVKNKESKENLIKTLEDEYGLEDVGNVINPEEEKKILSGEISEEELNAMIETKKEEDKKRQEEVNSTVLSSEEICKNAINKAVNEMYYLKTDYLVELKGIESEIIKYYNSLMTQEGMTKIKAKLSVAQNYTKTMLAFQKKCDAAVDIILGELETVLKNNGGDLEISKQIRAEYDNMKKEKLSQYMARYNKK